MNRRTFLQSTGSALAAAALSRPSLAAADEARPFLKKAVNLNMVSVPGGSILDRFKAAREAGFEALEVNRPDAQSLDELLEARAATGMEIAGVICSTHWGKPLSSPDPAVVEAGLKGARLALRDAAELGCTRLLLVPGVVTREVRYDQCWQRAQEAIKKLLPDAEKAKCRIGIENVWNQFIMSPLEAARFVDELASPWAGWHLDLGNLVTYGWPEHWVRILGPRICNLHIKEFSRKKRDAEGLWKGFAVELGEGDNDWPATVKALAEVGYRGAAIAEVPGGDAARLKFLAGRMDQILA